MKGKTDLTIGICVGSSIVRFFGRTSIDIDLSWVMYSKSRRSLFRYSSLLAGVCLFLCVIKLTFLTRNPELATNSHFSSLTLRYASKSLLVTKHYLTLCRQSFSSFPLFSLTCSSCTAYSLSFKVYLLTMFDRDGKSNYMEGLMCVLCI